MGIIRTSAFSVSIDGFAAGLHQTIDNPFGERGMALPDWMLKTRMFHTMTSRNGGSIGVDNGFAERSMENIGAWIMGRNMFGPIRGPAGRLLEGVVGPQSALSHAGVRAHPSRAAVDRDGGRHRVPIRDRWDQSRAEAGARGCEGPGCQGRRRRFGGSPVP